MCRNQSFDLQCLSADFFFSFFFFLQLECLLTGFFEHAMRYHFLLAWHFLYHLLPMLLIIFKFSVYLVFFIQYFFSTRDCAFPMSRGLVNFAHHDLEMMFTNVTSWSLRLFLNIPLFNGKSFPFKDAG